jgi:hypothetical protein
MPGVSRDDDEIGTRIGTHRREPETTYQNGSGSTTTQDDPSDTPSKSQLF